MFEKLKIIGISFMFINCASMPKLALSSHQHITEKNITKINGTYSNFAANSDKYTHLTISGRLTSSRLRDTISEIKLKILNDKKIQFSILKDQKEIDSKIVKYEIQNNGLLLLRNKNFRLHGIPWFFGDYEIRKYEIGLSNNGNLIINGIEKREGAHFMILWSPNIDYKFSDIYERKYKAKTKYNTDRITKYTAEIDSLIQTTKPRKFNGVISISQKGKKIYSKTYGDSDLDSEIPINLNDNFRIQSNSKQITAVMILKEVEKGNIKLENKISKYLPEFNAAWINSVTIHQLLNMSAGIVSFKEPLLFKPGTDFYYSNPAYSLLGRIIKKVTGKEYIEVADSLFKELGMHNTYCYQFDRENQKLVNGYQWVDNKYKIVQFSELDFTKEAWNDFIPAGGIISNIQDLHIWDSKLHNGELLEPKSYAIMMNSEIPDLFTALSDEEISYGYGINIVNRPLPYIGHGGSGFGFANIKFYVPEKDLNVIVLENVYHENIAIRYHFEKEVRKILLN